jgi:hypothetical protein
VIVRIPAEGQFRLDDQEAAQLNDLDNRLVELVERGDEAGFTATLRELLDLVRSHGDQLPDEEIVPSSIVLPPPDLTFDEAQHLFQGDGLIPD